MTAKHTPGPWTIKKCQCGFEGCNQYFISVYGVEGRVSEPDARLIAAAPELLDALKAFYKAFALHNCPESIEPALFYATMEKAEVTIAKAEGRE